MKNPTESLEQASVRQYCKAVRMPAVGANFISMAEQAAKENHSHIWRRSGQGKGEERYYRAPEGWHAGQQLSQKLARYQPSRDMQARRSAPHFEQPPPIAS